MAPHMRETSRLMDGESCSSSDNCPGCASAGSYVNVSAMVVMILLVVVLVLLLLQGFLTVQLVLCSY